MQIEQEIAERKAETGAVILAHNYQRPEIQDIADIVGDSFELARKASTLEEELVIFCGVHFMAESCKILSPDKKVILPAPDAGCPLADTITGDQLRAFKSEYPGLPVVTYINSTADVKAESDICCTSSNALEVVESLDSDRILFTPDGNLAHYVQQFTEKQIIPWDGYCIVHHRVMVEDIIRIKAIYDDAWVIAHPECQPEVVEMADVVCSTSKMIPESKNAPTDTIVVVTEEGMRHPLQQAAPDKQFVLATPKLVCRNMKKTTLEHVRDALRRQGPEIVVDPEIARKAVIPLERMLAIGAGIVAGKDK